VNAAAPFVVHLRDRPAALERFLGLVRRRRLAVERLTVNPGPDGMLELRFQLDESRTAPARLAAELEALVDLARLEKLAGSGDAIAHPTQDASEPGE
jgi:acetolactate synthase regulatory subunit